MSSFSETQVINLVNSKFLETIREFSLLNKNDRVLIGLSGGADSVLLSYLLDSFKDKFSLELFVCHVNHQLRDKESERDEAFCKSLAERLSIPFFSFRVNVKEFARFNKLSIEEAARILRYQSFEKIINELKINKLAIAHNLDDLFETILYRIIKGCGVQGILGIPVKKRIFSVECDIIRPLLFVEKKYIEKYIKIKNLNFVFDSTNTDTRYSRNFIRKKIVPLIEERFPVFRKKIEDFYKILWEEEKYWEEKIMEYQKFVSSEGNNCEIKIDKGFFDLNLSLALKRRFLRHVIGSLNPELYLPLRVIDRMLGSYSENGTKFLYISKELSIYQSYGDLIIKKGLEKFENPSFLVKLDKEDLNFEFKDYKISFYKRFKSEIERKDFKSSGEMIFFNMDLSSKLFVRKLKKGDRIEIEKNKFKKLSDIFIDNKIKRWDRENSLVIYDEDNILVAVFIPLKFVRVSRRYYVESDTEKVGIIKIFAKK